jgi:hypothetical protein
MPYRIRRTERLWNIRPAGGLASLHLDVRRPDNLAPLFSFVGDEPAEVGGRDDKRRASQVGKPRLDFGIGTSSRLSKFAVMSHL